MYIVFRVIYRTLRRLSAFHFTIAHALDWAGYKLYNKCQFGKHQRVGK